MSAALELPDSTVWRLGVLHERERIIRLLEQRCEDLCTADTTGWSVHRREDARCQLQRAINSIHEAG